MAEPRTTLEETKLKLEQFLGRKLEPSTKLFEILTLLANNNALPSLKTNVYGAGEAGSFNPIGGGIQLAPSANTGLAVPTHEYTHALDNLMRFRSGDWNNSSKLFGGIFSGILPQQAQFSSAYQKMDTVPSTPSTEKDSYRNSKVESRAFGVGNQAPDTAKKWAVPHRDATSATEFDILMDLFRRTGLESSIK